MNIQCISFYIVVQPYGKCIFLLLSFHYLTWEEWSHLLHRCEPPPTPHSLPLQCTAQLHSSFTAVQGRRQIGKEIKMLGWAHRWSSLSNTVHSPIDHVHREICGIPKYKWAICISGQWATLIIFSKSLIETVNTAEPRQQCIFFGISEIRSCLCNDVMR